MSDASLDLITPLNVCVVDVSPALQQQVSHEEHERPQLLLFLHLDSSPSRRRQHVGYTNDSAAQASQHTAVKTPVGLPSPAYGLVS